MTTQSGRFSQGEPPAPPCYVCGEGVSHKTVHERIRLEDGSWVRIHSGCDVVEWATFTGHEAWRAWYARRFTASGRRTA